MGSPRRIASAMVVVAAVGAATIGVTAAVADQDDPPVAGSSDDQLLERLGALEPGFPDPYAELDEDIGLPDEDDEEVEFDVHSDYFSEFRGALAPVEDDLRRLFVDADDADGEVAEAVSLVAAGWLDMMNSAESFAAYSAHDLAFPRFTSDEDGVATGADRLRGLAEQAYELFMAGADKHHTGYLALRELSAADGATQTALDARAASLDLYEEVGRPLLVDILSKPSTTVLVPIDRFDTKGPGVESRASSLSYVCLDRALFEAETRPLTEEVLVELVEATGEREDCGRFGIWTPFLDEG